MGLQMEGFETVLTSKKNIKIRLSFSYQISLKSRRLSNLNIKSYPPPSQSVLGVKFPDGSRQDEPFFD